MWVFIANGRSFSRFSMVLSALTFGARMLVGVRVNAGVVNGGYGTDAVIDQNIR
jgi:hypothetical protein